MARSKYQGYLIIALVSALLAFLIANLYLVNTNTLKSRNKWLAPKAEGERSVANGRYFFEDKVSISQGSLNLGVWHGNQEIQLREPVTAKKITFDFEIQNNGVLYFFWQGKDQERRGIRISNSELYQSIQFGISDTGKFFDKIPLKPVILKESGNSAEMIIDNQIFSFSVNGQLLVSEKAKISQPLTFGFRNASVPATLHRIFVYGDGDEVVFRETFYWNEKATKLFSIIAVFCFFCLALLLYSFELRKFFAVLLGLISLSGVSAIIWASQFFFFNLRYPKFLQDVSPPVYNQQKKSTIKNPDITANTGEPFIRFNRLKLPFKRNFSVLFLGGSQTYGEGARKAAEAWPNALISRLKQSGKVQFKSDNLASPGAASDIILAALISHLGKEIPDLIILNTGTNDSDTEYFRQNVKKLIVVSLQKKVPLLILLEANDLQISSVSLEENHKALKTLAEEHSIPYLDMHRHLMEPAIYDSGIIWQDHVHPTSYGHSLIAEKVLETLTSFFIVL